MNSISLKAKVDADGKLSLQLPEKFANQELDLVVVYQIIEQDKTQDSHKVVDSFYGSLEDDPILVEEESKKEIAWLICSILMFGLDIWMDDRQKSEKNLEKSI